MVCDNCGRKGATIKRMTRSYGKGGQIVVIENIPLVVCPNCGESYLTSVTLQEIERLKLHRKHMKAKRQAPVISYV